MSASLWLDLESIPKDTGHHANTSIWNKAREIKMYVEGPESEEGVAYTVHVKTGNKKGAATNDNIFIRLVGEAGFTSKRKLASSLPGGGEEGDWEEYKFKDKSVGRPKFIVLEKKVEDGWRKADNWLLEEVRVQSGLDDGQIDTTFRFSDWVSTSDPFCVASSDSEDQSKDVDAEKNNILKMLDDKAVTYKVSVVTGDVENAGTCEASAIVLVGDRGATEKHMLANNQDRGEKTDTAFKDVDIGSLELIIITIGRDFAVLNDPIMTKNSAWYLETIEVSSNKSDICQVLPYHNWVTRSDFPVLVDTHKSELSQEASLLSITSRLQTIHTMRRNVQWTYEHPDFGPLQMPGMFKANFSTLDNDYKIFEDAIKDKNARGRSALFSRKLLQLKSLHSPDLLTVEQPEDLLAVTRIYQEDEQSQESIWLEDWDKDEEFGRQQMNGNNPMMIKRIHAIPDKFPVSDEQVSGLLQRGLSLAEEAKEGNIYIVDCHLLEGIKAGTYEEKTLEVAIAMCLFYLRPDNELVPLAIQLGQKPGPDFPIWTPNDSRVEWLLAKAWFRNSDFQLGGAVNHLCYSHFVLEPFAVAMHRCLPPSHPVNKMLKHTLRFIISIDVLARDVLINAMGGGTAIFAVGRGSRGVLSVCEKSLKNFSYEELQYPRDLAQRDVMDLPGYHHRDDSLKLWGAMEDYTKSMVNLYYQSDEHISSDFELQAWVAEVFNAGFGHLKNVTRPSLGLPEVLTTKAELVTYLTTIQFTSTARHAAAHAYWYEYARFSPNLPTIMRGSLPVEADRGHITMKRLVDSLPDFLFSAQVAGTSKALVAYPVGEVFLQETPMWMFTDQKTLAVWEAFSAKLSEIEAEIIQRNSTLRVPYTVLLPSKLPAGISA